MVKINVVDIMNFEIFKELNAVFSMHEILSYLLDVGNCKQAKNYVKNCFKKAKLWNVKTNEHYSEYKCIISKKKLSKLVEV